MKFTDFIKEHFDFRIYPVTVIAILVALSIIPCAMYLPPAWGYENGIIEDIQMLTLIIGLFLAVFAKENKQFFYFVGLSVFMIMAREVSYGRTLFLAVPGEPNVFYSWKDFKYGWLVNPLVGLYITGTFLYFIVSKAYLQMWNIIKKVKFPVWNFLLAVVGISVSLYIEKHADNDVFEEMAELLFYVAVVGIIWLYAYNKNFSTK